MSGHMKAKLFIPLSKSASSFHGAATRLRPLTSHITTNPDFAPRALSQNRRLHDKLQNAITRSHSSRRASFIRPNPTSTASRPPGSANVFGELECIRKASEPGNPFPVRSHIFFKAIHTSRQLRKKNGAWKPPKPLPDIQNPAKSANGFKKPGEPNPATRQPENDAGGRPVPEAHSYFNLPHLPKLPHRPTKEELLAAATGFWSRMRVRFKWFSIRSVRPWNVDDWSAFVSWFVVGHIVWILVGTTTFFSLLIFAINTVVAQGNPMISHSFTLY